MAKRRNKEDKFSARSITSKGPPLSGGDLDDNYFESSNGQNPEPLSYTLPSQCKSESQDCASYSKRKRTFSLVAIDALSPKDHTSLDINPIHHQSEFDDRQLRADKGVTLASLDGPDSIGGIRDGRVIDQPELSRAHKDEVAEGNPSLRDPQADAIRRAPNDQKIPFAICEDSGSVADVPKIASDHAAIYVDVRAFEDKENVAPRTPQNRKELEVDDDDDESSGSERFDWIYGSLYLNSPRVMVTGHRSGIAKGVKGSDHGSVSSGDDTLSID